jgi:ABC-type polar amino acid transport system ATPase subunit
MLEVRGLRKAFGEVPVLADVAFELKRGETLAIVGRSGSGKTTLLKCLTLLVLADQGEIVLEGQTYFRDGTPEFEPWEVRRNIALVFQEFNLFPNMTVLQNITFGMERVKSFSRSEAIGKAREIARTLQIDHILNQYPQAISGGQAQRCALARAVVLHPNVLLLDEVTSALDPESIAAVIGAIRTIRSLESSKDMAIILVTHFLKFAEEFADKIALMQEGRLIETLPAREFARNARSPETRTFISNASEWFS